LYEGLVDRKCEHGLDAAVRRLSKLSLSADALRKSAEIINDRAITRPVSVGEISIQVGGFSYKMPTDIQGFQVNVMHAVISGDELVRKNLGMNLENAAQVLWGELLGWQSLHFGLRSAKAFGALLELAQGALAKQVISNSTQAETDLEVYTLLEALRHPVQSVSFRIALPNLKLIKDDGRDENEYDVVSVVLKQDKHVEVWVWGVTVEQNLTPKRNADMAKIQKLKDLLGQRWAADVRVVTCYVHKDGDDICLEIDGCQSRRIVAREVVTDTT